MEETTNHELCRSFYDCDGAEILLEGDGGKPALVKNRTKWGKTALFTIPPTVVRRSIASIPLYGQESISTLVNRAAAAVMRMLGNPQVCTSAGKCIAFEDATGKIHAIAEEDSWPHPGHTISPLVTIRMHNAAEKKVSCDKDFAVVQKTQEKIFVRIAELHEHESAIITIESFTE